MDARNLQKNQPQLVLVVFSLLGLYLIFQFGYLLAFLPSAIVPIFLVVVHAALRKRIQGKVRINLSNDD